MTWNSSDLDAARKEGDPLVDDMAARLFSGPTRPSFPGRLGYHHLLDIADRLLEAPELYLAKDSQLHKELMTVPVEFRTYFDPVPAPDWVDADQLAIASRVWNENMMAIIWVLYAASLPSCYLIAKGIPTLYMSGKLGQERYIYQRIYETGLMLEAVMEPGGLTVVNDLSVDAQVGAKRFVWGRGLIAAHKVRMLHASMRYLLLNQAANAARGAAGARLEGLAPFDVARDGLPINQEDLAYTLLTFGYAIPTGLKRWGCRLSDVERDAFLHTWRLVAHLMGVKDQLVATSWTQAEELFMTIQGRQKASSPMGLKLTDTLQQFLQEYLPVWFRTSLPPMLIISQMGEKDAGLILSQGKGASVFLRGLFAFSLLMVRIYYWLRNLLLRSVPAAGTLMGDTFRLAGNAVVDSWRDDYNRRPFYLPQSADAPWVKQPGVTPENQKLIYIWRIKLFYAVVAGIACVFCAIVLAGLWLLLVALRATGCFDQIILLSLGTLGTIGAVAALSFIAGLVILHALVSHLVANRPGPGIPPPVSATTTLAAIRRRPIRR